MASYNELKFDWQMLCLKDCQNWSDSDLQLAAELGKTLLERNKELESLLKKHQQLNEDQTQEIEYLTKQNVALREVNDSRLRIYESLDISIQELENEKHQLLLDHAADKKLIKNLNQTVESLEVRCDELSKQMEDLSRGLDTEKRKNERLNESLKERNQKNSSSRLHSVPSSDGNASESENEMAPPQILINSGHQHMFMDISKDCSGYPSSHDTIDSGFNASNNTGIIDQDDFMRIVTELDDVKRQYVNEHTRATELEQQISVIAQENTSLQSRLAQANTLDEMKSVHEELSFLEEVRQGQMCSNCLRKFDDRMVPTENTSYIGTEGDDEDQSLIDLINSTAPVQQNHAQFRSSLTIKDDDDSSIVERPTSLETTPKYNPYKELVERYEALLKVQRDSRTRITSQLTEQKIQQQNNDSQPISLHDELMNSGDFSSFNTKYTSDDEGTKKSSVGGVRHKTPTDFSEVETTSSGFSDETSNKSTQTDLRSGAFLCTIADGEDCKFTIYDDASPIDSRFRDRPKYRELFKEIFTVLKKAAENKDEGEKLPLLDDQQPISEQTVNIVPPVTPATENIPQEFDSQSIMSSVISENSIAVSECITKTERRKAKQQKKQLAKEPKEETTENRPPISVQMLPSGKLVTPYNRDALDFLALSAKKKTRRSRQRSKDKYSGHGRDTSNCSNASGAANTNINYTQLPDDAIDDGHQSKLTNNNNNNNNKDHRSNHQQNNSKIRAHDLTDFNRYEQVEAVARNTHRRRTNNHILQSFSTVHAVGSIRPEWDDSRTGYNRNSKQGSGYTGFNCRPNPSVNSNGEIEFKQSAASHELMKLKKLDLSYAQVLRRSERMRYF